MRKSKKSSGGTKEHEKRLGDDGFGGDYPFHSKAFDMWTPSHQEPSPHHLGHPIHLAGVLPGQRKRIKTIK